MNTRMWLLGSNQDTSGLIFKFSRCLGTAEYAHFPLAVTPAQAEAGAAQSPSAPRKFFAVAICLLCMELASSWYVSSEILSRAMMGVIAYIGLVQTLPPEIALYHAQKIAVMDLL